MDAQSPLCPEALGDRPPELGSQGAGWAGWAQEESMWESPPPGVGAGIGFSFGTRCLRRGRRAVPGIVIRTISLGRKLASGAEGKQPGCRKGSG